MFILQTAQRSRLRPLTRFEDLHRMLAQPRSSPAGWKEVGMLRKRFSLVATYVVAVCGFFPMTMVAQVATADLVGQITDSSHAVISGVIVAAENVSTGLVRKASTDPSGNWTITALPIGTYRLRAEHVGFKAAVSEVVLAASDRRRVDIVMEIGQVEQSVDVTAIAPALQADSSTIGALVTSNAVQDLPLNGRNFIRLAQLVP